MRLGARPSQESDLNRVNSEILPKKKGRIHPANFIQENVNPEQLEKERGREKGRGREGGTERERERENLPGNEAIWRTAETRHRQTAKKQES